MGFESRTLHVDRVLNFISHIGFYYCVFSDAEIQFPYILLE